MERTALFAGTFDPFTKGHHALVLRALAIFDKVVVAVGRNMGKKCLFTVEQRVEAIEKLYAADKRVEVMAYDGLTMDLAKEIGATALLRGVRNTKDFEYEREIADVNFRIGGIETVLLMSEPEHASISSSIVRELMNYGKDVTALLPNMQE
ncbi:MAG: pantetheine-phosphate adenylyltransferase [Bacteroidaceae bacterium]|nr:pantetheine-phosphate adenylyltransferase [Bacteroidaceae bacterium]